MNVPHPKITQLGQKTVLTPEQIEHPETILEVFRNPRPGRDFRITEVFPEFTSVCPVTAQPDFATITVEYVPGDWCVEMKSLKLYFFAYRNKGAFYEEVTNTIFDHLTELVKPRWMKVTGVFNARGGMTGVVVCETK